MPAGLRQLTQLRDQRLFIGKSMGLRFGVTQRAVDDHIEHTTGAAHQGRIDIEGALEPGSQTGRSGQIVSGAAVGNTNLHHTILSEILSETFRRRQVPPWPDRLILP